MTFPWDVGCERVQHGALMSWPARQRRWCLPQGLMGCALERLPLPASYSIEQGIRHCFDSLTSTPSLNTPKHHSSPPTTPSLLPQHNHNHAPSAGNVRLHPRQSNLLNLLPLPPSPLSGHNLNPPPLKSKSLRHNKHPSTNRPARPIPQLLGPRQHRALLSINFCIPSPFSRFSGVI